MAYLKQLWSHNRGFMLFLGLMLVFRSAVADWNYVPSSSMNPTLVAGDRVMVNKLAYSLRVPLTLHHLVRWSSPQPGDVITFDSPKDDVNLIKRVVAVAGDRVEMRDNTLVINGRVVPRTLVADSRIIPSELGPLDAQIWREQLGPHPIEVARLPAINRYRDFAPVQVPEGAVMVLGDSRDNSNDSRFIGFINVDRVTGRAVRVVMSHDPLDWYLPRAGRWWLPLHG
ncbi:MAG: signal peptidase I [Ramlibacter sp.]|nr:signal peptidase I [Ramlibacter sp.]MBX3660090.1 signal peptidase I [Ramlibacter sp.]